MQSAEKNADGLKRSPTALTTAPIAQHSPSRLRSQSSPDCPTADHLVGLGVVRALRQPSTYLTHVAAHAGPEPIGPQASQQQQLFAGTGNLIPRPSRFPEHLAVRAGLRRGRYPLKVRGLKGWERLLIERNPFLLHVLDNIFLFQ